VSLRSRFAVAGGRARASSTSWSAPTMSISIASADSHADVVRGRIALVGDAAFCASLMAGKAQPWHDGRYVLVGVGRMGDSMRKPSNDTRPFCGPTSKPSKEAQEFSGAFAPRPIGLFVRNLIIGATTIPGLARLAFAETSSID